MELTHPICQVDVTVQRAGLKFKPTGDHVLIAKLPDERLEESGLIIVPPSARRRSEIRTTWGMVLAIGEEVCCIGVSDYVHWGQYGGYDDKRDTHFDIRRLDGGNIGTCLALPGVHSANRSFVMLRQHEIDIVLTCEPGEKLPTLSEA